MNKFNLWFNQKSDEETLVSAYRERLVYVFAITFLVILLPVMLFNLRRGQPTLAAGLGCLMIVFLLNIVAIRCQRGIIIAKMLCIVGMSGVVGIALASRGIQGTYWAFPVVVFICFAVSPRQARIFTALFFVYIAALSFYLLDFSLALRAVFTLFVTILFMHIFLNIIEKLQDELLQQSLRDPLTGCYNRRQMISSLEEAAERKRRTKIPATILFIDIDNFKAINDSFGHATGDRVLKKFVAIVSKRIHHLDQLFRIGGEEFMLLLPDTSAKNALILAEEICALIAQSHIIEESRVTVSIGLSELGANETIDEWIKHGDNALYSAKENGRNQVFCRVASEPPQSSATEKIRAAIIESVQQTCLGELQQKSSGYQNHGSLFRI